MAQKNIIVGNKPNDGTGDTIRNAFIKTNANFTELYNNYDELIDLNAPDLQVWEKPSDWLNLNIPSDEEQRFTAIYAVSNSSFNYCAFTVEGNFTVDWGDGSSNSYTSGTKAEHQYDFNNSTLNGSLTSDGFKQAIITVTPQTGSLLTSVDLGVQHSYYTGKGLVVEAGFLEIAIASSNLTTLKVRQTGTASYATTDLNDIELPGETLTYQQESGISVNSNIKFNFLRQLYIGKNSLTTISSSFRDCINLKKVERLDLSTTSCHANYAFYGCESLQTVKNFKIVSQEARSMFQNCYSMKYIISDKIAVKYADSMFRSCETLKYFKVNDFTETYNCEYMFRDNFGLKRVCIYFAEDVRTFSGAFWNNSSLLTALITFSNTLLNSENMFYDCNSLVKIKFTDTPLLTYTEYMFENCYSLRTVENLNFSNFDTGYLSYGPFMNTYSLEKINFNIQNTSSSFDFTSVFYDVYSRQSLKEVSFGNFGLGSNLSQFFNYCFYINKVSIKLPINSDSVFYNSFITTTEGIDTSSVTSGNQLFSESNGLIKIDSLNFSNLQKANSIFKSCNNLIEIGSLNFANVAYATDSFKDCPNLIRSQIYGIKVSHSYANCCTLSGPALNEIFTNLGTPIDGSQTIDLTNVLGTDDPLFSANIATSKGWNLTY